VGSRSQSFHCVWGHSRLTKPSPFDALSMKITATGKNETTASAEFSQLILNRRLVVEIVRFQTLQAGWTKELHGRFGVARAPWVRKRGDAACLLNYGNRPLRLNLLALDIPHASASQKVRERF
jgi:hypothetical protein